MIHITGDTHGDLFRFHPENMHGEDTWTENDKLIICGDFGFLFYPKNDSTGQRSNNMQLDCLESRPYEILFVDGNHENFDWIYEFPEVERYGGTVHKIRENIYHLQRGQIYTIDGKTFFTFGGAYSTDKVRRIEGISWWRQELPTADEYKHGIQALKNANNKVDYIITHTPPQEIIKLLGYIPDHHDAELTGFFDWVMHDIQFKAWYCGHMHEDKKFTLPNGKEIYELFYGVEAIE